MICLLTGLSISSGGMGYTCLLQLQGIDGLLERIVHPTGNTTGV